MARNVLRKNPEFITGAEQILLLCFRVIVFPLLLLPLGRRSDDAKKKV